MKGTYAESLPVLRGPIRDLGREARGLASGVYVNAFPYQYTHRRSAEQRQIKPCQLAVLQIQPGESA